MDTPPHKAISKDSSTVTPQTLELAEKLSKDSEQNLRTSTSAYSHESESNGEKAHDPEAIKQSKADKKHKDDSIENVENTPKGDKDRDKERRKDDKHKEDGDADDKQKRDKDKKDRHKKEKKEKKHKTRDKDKDKDKDKDRKKKSKKRHKEKSEHSKHKKSKTDKSPTSSHTNDTAELPMK